MEQSLKESLNRIQVHKVLVYQNSTSTIYAYLMHHFVVYYITFSENAIAILILAVTLHIICLTQVSLS